MNNYVSDILREEAVAATGNLKDMNSQKRIILRQKIIRKEGEECLVEMLLYVMQQFLLGRKCSPNRPST